MHDDVATSSISEKRDSKRVNGHKVALGKPTPSIAPPKHPSIRAQAPVSVPLPAVAAESGQVIELRPEDRDPETDSETIVEIQSVENQPTADTRVDAASIPTETSPALPPRKLAKKILKQGLGQNGNTPTLEELLAALIVVHCMEGHPNIDVAIGNLNANIAKTSENIDTINNIEPALVKLAMLVDSEDVPVTRSLESKLGGIEAGLMLSLGNDYGDAISTLIEKLSVAVKNPQISESFLAHSKPSAPPPSVPVAQP